MDFHNHFSSIFFIAILTQGLSILCEAIFKKSDKCHEKYGVSMTKNNAHFFYKYQMLSNLRHENKSNF